MSDQGGSTVSRKDILRMTVRVSAAYLSQNQMPTANMPTLINDVHDAIARIALNGEPHTETVVRKPAVAVSKSVAPNYIVCLEDGRRMKTLKRHLKAAYGLTPEEYRQRWNLPADYPMVAPRYAQQRSQFAKKIGLGKNRPSKA